MNTERVNMHLPPEDHDDTGPERCTCGAILKIENAGECHQCGSDDTECEWCNEETLVFPMKLWDSHEVAFICIECHYAHNQPPEDW